MQTASPRRFPSGFAPGRYTYCTDIAHLHYCQFDDGSSAPVDRVIPKRRDDGQKSDRGEHDPSRFITRFRRVLPIKSFAFGGRRGGTLRSVHLANRTLGRYPLRLRTRRKMRLGVRRTIIFRALYSRARVFGVNSIVVVITAYVFDGRTRDAIRRTLFDGRERRAFSTIAQPLAREQHTIYIILASLSHVALVHNIIITHFPTRRSE